ncbi:MAG TPA: protocatechuate 3,4-dioxygenase subunit beta [Hyphomicrobiaceae bacterium]|nr:protocatechuate 3,4-dioxygenase subunit beta [Hyphomicrobiaceae bacterium]
MTAYPTKSLAAHPPFKYPAYKGTIDRAPTRPLVIIPQTMTELTGPMYGHESVKAGDSDLTRQHAGDAIGERIIVSGRVLDESGRPVPNTLLEVWQCNAAGRYRHSGEQHDAPLDPNFSGAGRAVTDAEGRYRFTTIKPGAYPWPNDRNSWRPAHIHFSLFGPTILSRLITQMYFPGDPLLPLDTIFMSAPEGARDRLISRFDIETTQPNWALGYQFDIVLRGRAETPTEAPHHD